MQEGYLICRIIYPSLQVLYYLNPDSTNIAPRIVLATDHLKKHNNNSQDFIRPYLLSFSKSSLWGTAPDLTRILGLDNFLSILQP